MEVTVFVVDDDQAALESVCMLARSMHLQAEAFESAEAFLDVYDDSRPGCVVTDVRMLGLSGIELLEELGQRNCSLPVVVLTAFATTPVTVSAMQAGAVTLLDKPYHDDDLWDAINKSLKLNVQLRKSRLRVAELRSRFGELTPKEREVLEFVLQGLPNKMIARQLDVSIRTVENRRREILTKIQVETAIEVAQLAMEADLLPLESESRPAGA
jgi:two-component system, LuxR family, response regulator FixJ